MVAVVDSWNEPFFGDKRRTRQERGEKIIAKLIGGGEERKKSALEESHEYEMKPDVINLMFSSRSQRFFIYKPFIHCVSFCQCCQNATLASAIQERASTSHENPNKINARFM